ncbi:hypothetical protein Y032_0012g1768 [Ancylostoma ceylanicum]|uniref:Uncharacterized protein n=1 Tax=Ancylostoma ceylanicum TaxID=53326 RepID=A0A016VC25_9BILA|nr:hypothetical protein Y032_0012g1768 [Ancylostoma ceylanicum]
MNFLLRKNKTKEFQHNVNVMSEGSTKKMQKRSSKYYSGTMEITGKLSFRHHENIEKCSGKQQQIICIAKCFLFTLKELNSKKYQ